MAICNSCGNEYEQCMAITLAGTTLHFDCFECAIQIMAPQCNHCGTKILGHGVAEANRLFCCAHCARAERESGLRDTA